MNLLSKLSYISRVKKLELFNKLFSPTPHMRILDLGAEVNQNGNRGLQFIDFYPWKNNITAVNIAPEHIASIKKYYPQIKAVVADACNIPWPDKHFDIVYSNAVIEHVGNFYKQKKMASEIRRVSKSWFVATPNRWYPFEFHLRLPFITWLPGDSYLLTARAIRYNHVLGKYTFKNKKPRFHLLTAKELQLCFPTGRIIKQRVTFMAETLISIGNNI